LCVCACLCMYVCVRVCMYVCMYVGGKQLPFDAKKALFEKKRAEMRARYPF
jgi:hypothetical protein